jgi:hypothetical protein
MTNGVHKNHLPKTKMKAFKREVVQFGCITSFDLTDREVTDERKD